jgi:long-subunit acyl-CoA synthetase (AMP-forming)
MQDALSEAAGRLAILERDKEILKSTYVRASALKELENYLLERLSIQVCVLVFVCVLVCVGVCVRV